MLGFDPEVPAGYQDADIEMLELRQAADEVDEVCDNYTPPSWDENGPCRNCHFSVRSH